VKVLHFKYKDQEICEGIFFHYYQFLKMFIIVIIIIRFLV